ncbi:uncharacterized protein [Littorina saxatilis]|uniref:Secreted protein n=1 Tax=Littorina saxatilis TaxID=31220 RepID=A0AAN9BHB0_9CAEN
MEEWKVTLHILWFLAVLWDIFASTPKTGLTARPFYGLSNTEELECSGSVLDSDTSLLSLSLFSLHDDVVLASANVATKECLTSGYFSACLFHPSDNRRSKLRTLVTASDNGRERWFGCNATCYGRGRTAIFFWKLPVTVRRK